MFKSRDSNVRIINTTRAERLESSVSCKGNQIKWRTKNNEWVKLDMFGYEGLSEYLCSKILETSNIANYSEYELCKIIEDNTFMGVGCISNNFIKSDTVLFTLYDIFTLYKIDISKLFIYSSTKEKIIKVINLCKQITRIENLETEFSKLLYFDKFVLNEDRHFNNIGFLRDNEKFTFMPIFDNGSSFMSDITYDYPMLCNIYNSILKVKSKPFATRFKKQIKAIDNLYNDIFRHKKLELEKYKTYILKYYDEKTYNRIYSIYEHQCHTNNFMLKED